MISISSLLQTPSCQPDPIIQAERQVEAALNNLVNIGALQRNNWMDIESPLNPEGESNIMTESTDKEIYQVIIDAKAAHKNLKVNSGDDFEDDTPIEPLPTQCDILKATSTINKYISNLNDPNAHKIEGLLTELNRQLCL